MAYGSGSAGTADYLEPVPIESEHYQPMDGSGAQLNAAFQIDLLGSASQAGGWGSSSTDDGPAYRTPQVGRCKGPWQARVPLPGDARAPVLSAPPPLRPPARCLSSIHLPVTPPAPKRLVAAFASGHGLPASV